MSKKKCGSYVYITGVYKRVHEGALSNENIRAVVVRV